MIVKICGLTELHDVEAALSAGADWLGFNLVPSSKRALNLEQAQRLVQGVAGRAQCVAVVADMPVGELQYLLEQVGMDRVQLHGEEPDAVIQTLGPRAFKAVRVGDAADVAAAGERPGDPLLVDAKVPGQLGGTGQTVDWVLARGLAERRAILLAGGLTPLNVAAAVQAVHPFGVDVAGGVESSGNPRRKDPAKMRAFVAAARAAQG
jgi:phosphoribosylanthranilate isomerase